MSEYRAAIGRFSCVAENARARRQKKKKWKEPKLTKLNKTESCEERPSIPKSIKFKESSRSLDRWKRKDKTHDIGERRKSLSDSREGRCRKRNTFPSRTKSPSLSTGRKKKVNLITDNFKEACVACKTDMFDQRWERGRAKQNAKKTHQRSKQESICLHAGKASTTPQGTCHQLRLFMCVALSECLLLERALSAVVQMLLLRAGIESNPGPTDGNNSPPCCNASQHFNRVKNTIAKAKQNFKSKVTLDTLSKKVIEIEETGYCLCFTFTFLTNHTQVALSVSNL